MVTYINPNNSIDTIYELFISLAIVLFAMIFLCKVGNFLSSLPVKEVKKKSSKKDNVKDVKKETESINVVDGAKNNSANSTNSNVNNTPIIIKQEPNNNYQNNYLYDRFVDSPTKDDCVEVNKISQTFLSEKELDDMRKNNIKIRVKDSELERDKNKLYSRISQMTSSNLETREKLLKEFEGLSKEMKLLLIDNIIQKM